MYLINAFDCIYNSASHYCYTALLYVVSFTFRISVLMTIKYDPEKNSQWGKVTPAFQVIEFFMFCHIFTTNYMI